LVPLSEKYFDVRDANAFKNQSISSPNRPWGGNAHGGLSAVQRLRERNGIHFSETFNSKSAFNKIMANLNTLRAPIAHCSPLADDEVVRLRLTMRDWFRLMGINEERKK
jgi:hypothetical protein